MKTTFRIPTKDQFAFIEIEHESVENPEKTREFYEGYISEFKQKDGPGLPPQEWRKLLDAYLNGLPYDYESIIEKLNAQQRFCCNEIKKSRVRTESWRLAAKEPN